MFFNAIIYIFNCVNGRFFRHEPAAFLKVGETLAFLIRDAAHITPENFDSCVKCLRSYVEAGLDGGRYFLFIITFNGIDTLFIF